MSYLSRINEWKDRICSIYEEGQDASSLDKFEASCSKLFAEGGDVGGDLEISFREVLASLLDPSTNSNKLSPQQIPKLPFLMLEDIMECQTIEKAESTWQVIESLTDTITHPEIFPKGKLTVLRMCNSLLRKLSKSCNTEFCGRVLMFLAAIYPLSEKSALNLSGKVNTNNVTYFESEEEYLINAGCARPATATAGTETAESGAGAAEEKGEVGDADGESDQMDIEKSDPAGDADLPAPEIAYDLYRAFWRLQSFFASDQKSVDSIELWRDFMQHARTVVQLFEDYDFTDEELQQARAKAGTLNNGTQENGSGNRDGVVAVAQDQEDAYSGCKYLTSSQLFSLQLRDPIVRQQVAVQVLYFLHYLRSKNNPYAPAEHLAEVSKDMLFLHDKAYRLVERSPNDGAKLAAVLKRLLSRETRFISWKALACPEIEISRPVLSEEEAARREAFNLHKDSSHAFAMYKKRPAQRIKVKRATAADSAAAAQKLAGYRFDYSDAHVKSVARELVKNIPTYEEEIEQYVEAEDPDAGIEEEYHPKKNNLYCWRVRRLMAAQHLAAFEAMPDGDLGKGLRKLNNQPEPLDAEGGDGTEAEAGSSAAEGGASAVVGADGEGEGDGDGDAEVEGTDGGLDGEQEEAATGTEDGMAVEGEEETKAEPARPPVADRSTSNTSNASARGGMTSTRDGRDSRDTRSSREPARGPAPVPASRKRKLPAGKLEEAAEEGEEVEP